MTRPGFKAACIEVFGWPYQYVMDQSMHQLLNAVAIELFTRPNSSPMAKEIEEYAREHLKELHELGYMT